MKTKTINTLILSGGGSKGIAYCGVLKKLEELQNYNYNITVNIKEILGVSVGSIIGFLYAIGYKSQELINEMYKMKSKKLQEFRIVNLLNEWGLDSGESVINWIEELCTKKNINKWITFNELYEKSNINFRIGVTNLNKYEFEVFDKTNSGDTSILRIIRLSFNLPFLYTKQEYEGNIYLDGGVINNYPIYLYKDTIDNVLGLKLISDGEIEPENQFKCNINSFEEYIFNTIYCYMIDKERKLTLKKTFIDNTIFINTGVSNAMNANIKKDEKIALIKSGYTSAEEFFKKYKCKLKLD